MSGIAGLLHLDGRPVDPAVLRKMIQRLAHRGPDGEGLWHSGPVGLAHRMLWTTPESLDERLPAVSRDGKLAITADARLDNREELLDAFGMTGERRRGAADSELLLLAYEKWDEGCLQKLLGDFAFVIWDGRREILFCGRDHLGIKPFYYHRSGGLFAFASEIKALLSLAEVPRRLDEQRLADFLAGLPADPPSTFYQGIARLPPAHGMRVTGTRIHQQAYWSLDPDRQLPPADFQEYARQFHGLFSEAVRCRLRSAFPLGASLSGGLDSSSVVCMARRLSSGTAQPLRTFSAVFPTVPRSDERPFIQSVIGQGGLQPFLFEADQISPLRPGGRIFGVEDEPYLPSHMFVLSGLYRLSRDNDVRILLDGFDGDRVVSYGYDYLLELASRWEWGALWAQAGQIAGRYGVSRGRVLWRCGFRDMAKSPLQYAWWFAQRCSPSLWVLNTIVQPSFVRRMGLGKRAFNRRWGRRPLFNARLLHWRSLIDGSVSLFSEIMDRAAAGFSVELRHPFLDKRVVEFCLALPPDQRLREGRPRPIVREALKGILPELVRHRVSKADLSPNFSRSLLKFEGRFLGEIFRGDLRLLEPYLNVFALRRAYRRFASENGGPGAGVVWTGATLALWLMNQEPK